MIHNATVTKINMFRSVKNFVPYISITEHLILSNRSTVCIPICVSEDLRLNCLPNGYFCFICAYARKVIMALSSWHWCSKVYITISQTPDIFSLVDAAWKRPKYPWFWILPLKFVVNIDIHKHENSEVLCSHHNKSQKEMSGNSRLQIHRKHVNRFHPTKCTGEIFHTIHFTWI